MRDIDSVSKKHKKYYLQKFSVDCKLKSKEKILKRHINEVLNEFDSDSDCFLPYTPSPYLLHVL